MLFGFLRYMLSFFVMVNPSSQEGSWRRMIEAQESTNREIKVSHPVMVCGNPISVHYKRPYDEIVNEMKAEKYEGWSVWINRHGHWTTLENLEKQKN
jgi:hypothetical protein